MEFRVVPARTKFRDVEELLSRMKEISGRRNAVIQAFDPDMVLSENHLIFSAHHAFKAFAGKRAIARRLESELLLWAAGTRRIGEAVERVGVKNPSRVVLLIEKGKEREVLEDLRAEEDEKLLRMSREKAERIKHSFGISEDKCGCYALEELLLERIALLALER
ncbi:MAG: KEOPS complex subunit Cgi121 [Candidatus Micrarchaeota archaeon]|nr:KEOPS complex subunit Cgi121 [Candidatus Micrarchaeota archaeon]